ncbi:DNA ligase D [Aestuariivirga sp.]|uniref:DNA ligase D n=1 Tax=Aestuariivirga sp. TaxID=2650926 RepID=UPI003919F68F
MRKGSARRASPLRDYSAKRDFSKTAEPAPAPAPAPGPAARRRSRLSFVVQKHAARRLHFDLRLELDGVLKSWAVTRGPSLRPGVRRLAVQTEDHPMAYKEWEGVIPKGEYGGGTMIVWDRGHWIPEGDPHEGLKAGKLTFRLEGERLKGSWSLVRLKDEAARQNWLLIKRSDEHALAAGETEPTERHMTSILSGKSNEDLETSNTLRADHKARASRSSAVKPSAVAKVPGARKAMLPAFVEPSLAMSVAEPPTASGWLHEIKHDGYRIQARLDGGKVKLLTRKGLDWTKRFPAVADAVKTLAAKAALIDGEIIVQDEQGHSTFSGLQTDLKSGRQDRIVFYVFDLLYLDGADIRGAPLTERKRLLSEVLSQSPQHFALRYNDHLDQPGEDILAQACRLGLEGIVSKKCDMPYVSGRGEHWVKSKCMLRQEFVVVGFLPASDRKNAVGSLVLGYYEEGRLMHAGRAGTGYSVEESASLFKLLKPLAAEKPKFANSVSRPAARDVVWIAPKVVAEIEYRGRTADGLVRQAAYVGLREDKPAAEVVLEPDPGHIPHRESRARRAPSARAEPAFAFTHPERVLWPDAGVTKQDLGDYYSAIAGWVLPHVANRVLSLLRCPGGASEKCFFAKHAWMGLDKSISLADTGDEKPMMSVADLSGLLALVQANVLEIHVWGSRIGDLERPDRLIFDLDPGEGIGWEDIKSAAVEMRERLQRLGLRSFLKTSGGKGLHVTVPVEPALDWENAKAFTKAVAQQMAADAPGRYVATMAKNRRQGRIFIDYLRNGRGATAVAPYSTRARAGAPVAMPIDWSELDALPSASHYTLKRALERLSGSTPDPWKDMARLRQKLKL